MLPLTIVVVTVVAIRVATAVAIMVVVAGIMVVATLTRGTTRTITLVRTIIRTIMGLIAHPTMGLITRLLPQAIHTLTARTLTAQAIQVRQQQLLRTIHQSRKLVLLL